MNRLGPGHQLVLGLAVFLLGAGVVVVTSGDDGAGDDDVAGGPTPGQDVADYIASRHAALAEAEGTRRAAVSFTEYLDVDEAQDRVGDGVEAWIVAGPGGMAEVTDDVDAWRIGRASAARAEAAELASLIPTVEDPEFVRQYERDRDRLARLADGLEAGEPVVFGAIIVAAAERLRAMAGRAGIRMVDLVDRRPAPQGLRPEERVVVGQPPERP